MCYSEINCNKYATAMAEQRILKYLRTPFVITSNKFLCEYPEDRITFRCSLRANLQNQSVSPETALLDAVIGFFRSSLGRRESPSHRI